eukprot:TRINITY_DN2226_c0_g2_i5.p1 TRINITY_DN2226_c0_g2~~TRINITY_DN2226_c0_g2_i5.p1  ORF type:complete len:220 (+),score=39.45 TRINITY_DN2226_c0_g2_i5:805-1464(+)
MYMQVIEDYCMNEKDQNIIPFSSLHQMSRNTNPLCPSYALPSFRSRHPTPPPLLRDPLDLTSVELHASRRPKPIETSPYRRNYMDYSDVEGNRPNAMHARPNRRNSFIRDPISVEDIMKPAMSIHKSHRHTNPLNPHYDFPEESDLTIKQTQQQQQLRHSQHIQQQPFVVWNAENREQTSTPYIFIQNMQPRPIYQRNMPSAQSPFRSDNTTRPFPTFS